jgi:hypothetical protein
MAATHLQIPFVRSRLRGTQVGMLGLSPSVLAKATHSGASVAATLAEIITADLRTANGSGR